MTAESRLILVSNQFIRPEDLESHAGGLVDALMGYMAGDNPNNPRGLWIGAVSDQKYVPVECREVNGGFLLQKGVFITKEEHIGHYVKACNQGHWMESHLGGFDTLLLNNFLRNNSWSLSHIKRPVELQLDSDSVPFYYPLPIYNPDAQTYYETVCEKFARSIKEECYGNEIVMCHDYHLMSVGKHLRDLGLNKTPLGYFHHIPVPPYRAIGDLIKNNPSASNIVDTRLKALLHYDAVGFQTEEYLKNLISAYQERKTKGKLSNINIWTITQGSYRINHNLTKRGYTYLFAEPIGVNPDKVIEAAKSGKAKRALDEFDLGDNTNLSELLNHCRSEDMPVFLGFDRADVTKGFFERLLIFDYMLRQGVPFVSISFAVPTRTEIDAYNKHFSMIKEMARNINNHHKSEGSSALSGIFDKGYKPIYLVGRKIKHPEIQALRRMGNEGAFSTRDGMQIGVLQHILANSSCPGTNFTMVSRGCGVYQLLGRYARGNHGIVGLNMFNIEESANAIMRAIKDKTNRHSTEVIEAVRGRTIDTFVERNLGYIKAAFEDNLSDF